jgi:DICT domain-containing protein
VERILRVKHARARGLALAAAVEQARGEGEEVRSLFAHLRKRRPHLQAITIRKRNLSLLARAIEDESLARAERALIIGTFQRERFFRQSQRRWDELARGAGQAFVFADFKRLSRPAGLAAEIPISSSHPLSQEWSLIFAASEHAVCMIGRERPGDSPSDDPQRRFEVVLSVEPEVVRDAAKAATTILAGLAPTLGQSSRDLLERLPVPSLASQLRLATMITARLLQSLRS